jgi:hypothetical protein
VHDNLLAVTLKEPCFRFYRHPGIVAVIMLNGAVFWRFALVAYEQEILDAYPVR